MLKNVFEICIKNQSDQNENQVVVEESIIQFLGYIKNYPLISYQINEKIDMVNIILDKLKAGKIENELFSIDILYSSLDEKIKIDNLSLKIIAQKFKLEEFYKESISEKVFLEALIFLKLNTQIKIERILK